MLTYVLKQLSCSLVQKTANLQNVVNFWSWIPFSMKNLLSISLNFQEEFYTLYPHNCLSSSWTSLEIDVMISYSLLTEFLSSLLMALLKESQLSRKGELRAGDRLRQVRVCFFTTCRLQLTITSPLKAEIKTSFLSLHPPKAQLEREISIISHSMFNRQCVSVSVYTPSWISLQSICCWHQKCSVITALSWRNTF
jgi:hypothetical protein